MSQIYENKIQPSHWYYYLAAVIGILGILFFAVFLYTSLSKLSEELVQIIVPCSQKMIWLEDGLYTIFYEYNSVVDNMVFSTSPADITNLTVKIENVNGDNINVQRVTTSSSYSLGSREGIGLFGFDIKQSGSYYFTAEYGTGSTEQKVVFAIGKEFMYKLFGMILTCIFIALTSFVICSAIIIIVYIKRRKSKFLLELEYSKIGRRS